MRALACVCGLFAWLLMAMPVGAGDRLTLKVSPAVSFAPANLVVRTMIEADKENRGMEIVAESADFYRSSEIELDGENAPRTNIFEFRSLPSGTYQVKAVLFDGNGQQRAQVRSQVSVVESGVAR
jgi:hypothetical protein